MFCRVLHNINELNSSPIAEKINWNGYILRHPVSVPEKWRPAWGGKTHTHWCQKYFVAGGRNGVSL